MQVDISPEELGNNVKPAVALFGDLCSVMKQASCTDFFSVFVPFIFPNVLLLYVCSRCKEYTVKPLCLAMCLSIIICNRLIRVTADKPV